MSFIPALIVQQDHTVNITDGVIGLSGLIPTPNSGGQVDSDYWAVPVNGFGIGPSGFKYIPTNPGDATPPDVQAFHVVRIIKNDQSTDWYAVGTSTQYLAASEEVECCGTTSPAPVMPTTAPLVAPCQVLCTQNSTSGLFEGNIGIPTLPAGEKFYAKGYFNDVALTALSTSGYTTAALLLTAIQAAWAATVGGTFTKTSDNLTLILTQADGPGTDVWCAVIYTA